VPPARALLWIATAGAIALAVRAIAFTPLPALVAVAALLAYVALVVFGVVFMRLEMFADVFWRGDEDARGVALTFDDGPSPEHTPRVLAMLEQAGVKATFFVIGHKAEAHPDLVRAVVAAGHGLGVHSYLHDRLFSVRRPAYVRADLERSIAILERITGERPRLFRPPIGHTNAVIARAARSLGLTLVGWSVRSLDGMPNATSERVARRVVQRLRDGEVVLLHDAAERDDRVPPSVDALPAILSAMKDKELVGVRVDEWLDADDYLATAAEAPGTPAPASAPARRTRSVSSR
jgi:peptidoglycan/xylan/chitin deacetylase (PgdA/CDA1 family)